MPEIAIHGPAGRLEARYRASRATAPPVAVVLHPHPLHGGAMNNKVVYTLFRCFADLDFSVLRLNFRGVGRSEGVHDGGDGERDDATAALDWIARENAGHGPAWIAGFSFGAWIAAKALMARPGVAGFVLVAPAAAKRDWSFLDPCPCDGLIVRGGADDIAPADSVAGLISTLRAQGRDARLETISGAGHFFETQLDLLRGRVERYVSGRLAG